MQYDKFGKFLKDKRESLNPKVSLNKFAINNDIEPATLSRIENMKQSIKVDTLAKLADGYGVLASELLAEYERLHK